MNYSTIAALYDAVNYPILQALPASHNIAGMSRSNALAWHVRRLLFKEALTGPNGRHYGVTAQNLDRTGALPRDGFGQKQYFEMEARLSERVFEWALRHLPHDAKQAGQLHWVVNLAQYASEAHGEDSVFWHRFAPSADFAVLLRGLRAYLRKNEKKVRKTLAQLAAYHQAKELRDLRCGRWLGAEKALTTAPRLDEPGVSFMGDVSLTAEQRGQLHYWSVNTRTHMSTAFPAGTGVALREITSSKQLVDGAVYVSQQSFGDENILTIGRLELARKERGFIPLSYDDANAPERHPIVYAKWLRQPDSSFTARLFQVVYYTTRAEQLAPALKPASTQPLLRVQGREQSLAQAA